MPNQRCDLIIDEELTKMLGKNFLNILTRQRVICFSGTPHPCESIRILALNIDPRVYRCACQEFVSKRGNIPSMFETKAESIVIEHSPHLRQ